MDLSLVALKRVLVTRPEPGASETARRLEVLGFLPLKLPLQETRPVSVETSAIRSQVAAIAIPSASAIRHAPRDLIKSWADLPCFAVGEATAATARSVGFVHVVEGKGDAESLAETVIASVPTGRVAYICGRVRRPVFEQRLADAGIPVVAVETYDTLALTHDAGSIGHIIGSGAIDYAMVHSANAATLLAGMMARKVRRNVFGSTILVCISARTAAVFLGLGNKIVVAGEPSERALLKALQDTVKPAS